MYGVHTTYPNKQTEKLTNGIKSNQNKQSKRSDSFRWVFSFCLCSVFQLERYTNGCGGVFNSWYNNSMQSFEYTRTCNCTCTNTQNHRFCHSNIIFIPHFKWFFRIFLLLFCLRSDPQSPHKWEGKRKYFK